MYSRLCCFFDKLQIKSAKLLIRTFCYQLGFQLQNGISILNEHTGIENEGGIHTNIPTNRTLDSFDSYIANQKFLSRVHVVVATDSMFTSFLTLEPHPKKLTLLTSWGPFGPQSCHGLPKHESVTYLATHVEQPSNFKHDGPNGPQTAVLGLSVITENSITTLSQIYHHCTCADKVTQDLRKAE